eukprot:1369648-Amphidinium_carterae.1
MSCACWSCAGVVGIVMLIQPYHSVQLAHLNPPPCDVHATDECSVPPQLSKREENMRKLDGFDTL